MKELDVQIPRGEQLTVVDFSSGKFDLEMVKPGVRIEGITDLQSLDELHRAIYRSYRLLPPNQVYASFYDKISKLNPISPLLAKMNASDNFFGSLGNFQVEILPPIIGRTSPDSHPNRSQYKNPEKLGEGLTLLTTANKISFVRDQGKHVIVTRAFYEKKDLSDNSKRKVIYASTPINEKGKSSGLCEAIEELRQSVTSISA